MQHVLVVDTDRKLCNPVNPGKARLLLSGGKAAVLRRYPFTIILKGRSEKAGEPLRLKIDPGSKETGIALVSEVTKKVLFALVLTHRGQAIKAGLDSRRAIRRSRRNRKTRYRKPRFLNRTRKTGWLPPSLQHRVETVMTWVNKLGRFATVQAISQELVRFDMQQMENPEISGIEYQQGTLAGYEVREYLLEKWGRKCAYCGAENTPLQIEHIHPKAKGGTNRESNLTLSCEKCNLKKGTQDIDEFLEKKPELLKKIQAQAKRPLKDAAAVNATRWALWERLNQTCLSIEAGSGGRTKYNRSTQGYPKQHWIDAACVGMSGEQVVISDSLLPLLVKSTGHGCRQVTRTDRFGFPRQTAKKGGSVFGFQTGDIVKAVVPSGKYQGTHSGRVAVRERGSFVIGTVTGKAETSYKNCSLVHRKDGYSYSL